MFGQTSNTSESSESPLDVSQSSLTRVRRSKVWEYYEQNLVAVDNILKAVCKFCGMHLSTKSGTSSLRTHIAEYCAKIDEPTRKAFVATMKKHPSENFIFNQQLARERMIDFVMHAEIPFNKFEDPYNEELVHNHRHELLLDGVHLHIRCCAHILNILVQDGMKVIHVAISKIRELLKHIDSSPSRIQAFNAIAVMNGLPSKRGIPLDIPTRWNSTLKMVAEALKYKAVLNSYANQYGELPPSEQEWEKAETICEFLRAFEEATNVVSADRKPTAHAFLPLVLCIRHALNDPGWQTNNFMKDLAAAMKFKFEKYWGSDESEMSNPRNKKKDYDFNLAIVIATMLDPRRKSDYLEFFYHKICNTEDQAEKCVDSALEWIRKYYQEYERRVRRATSHQVTCSSDGSRTMGSPMLGKRQVEAEYSTFKSRRRMTRATKSEIETYLEEDTEEDSENFDVLAWWKARTEKFPMLSTMARDFLAIPLSTVSSESAFSLGGRLLGDARSSLTPETLEALVCGKDWLYMEKIMDNENNLVNLLSRLAICLYLFLLSEP